MLPSAYPMKLGRGRVGDVLELVYDVTDLLLRDVITVLLSHTVHRAHRSRYLARLGWFC